MAPHLGLRAADIGLRSKGQLLPPRPSAPSSRRRDLTSSGVGGFVSMSASRRERAYRLRPECAPYLSTIEDAADEQHIDVDQLPPFTFNQLIMLRLMAKHGSIRGVAEAMYVSSSSVSQQLTLLEQKMKMKLVHRASGALGCVFTEEGQLLLRYAERILNASTEALHALDDQNNLNTGSVNLGASQTTGTYLIPRLVSSFQKKYPRVHVQLTVGSSSNICSAVSQGGIDVAIVGGEVPQHLEDIQVTTYTEEEFVLILPPQHPLSIHSVIEKEKLQALPFVRLNQNSSTQKFQTQTLKDHGIKMSQMNVQMEFNSIEAIKSAVQHGLGAAFVSQSAIEKELRLGLLHSATIKDMTLNRTLHLVTNSKRYFKRAAQTFTQEILTAADWYGIQQISGGPRPRNNVRKA